jgi:hypothetical protein
MESNAWMSSVAWMLPRLRRWRWGPSDSTRRTRNALHELSTPFQAWNFEYCGNGGDIRCSLLRVSHHQDRASCRMAVGVMGRLRDYVGTVILHPQHRPWLEARTGDLSRRHCLRPCHHDARFHQVAADLYSGRTLDTPRTHCDTKTRSL